MVIYNTARKEKERFVPLEDKRVRIYVCGPTVYDDAHLGHARSSVAFDLLRRTLTALGYDVTFVKNFTDIDDKILKKMAETGKSLEAITTHYIRRYKEDMHAIGVPDPDIEPRATESIDDIITFIEHLMQKGCAYVISDGVYFDTSKDPKYLCLSHRHVDESQNIARVEGSSEKRDPKDFALWKFSKAGEVAYESPWGSGRPGWHIECSAMIKKHLATDHKYQIDIHGGGADLLFPHHENEAAQSRCESGHYLARYWMHNGFVQINGEKMSKSLGNSFFLKDALKVYDGEVVRFYLLSTHYRANFNFNEEDLLASKKRLDRLYRLKKRLAVKSGSAVGKAFKKALLDALSDDLNISAALAVVDEMIQHANESLDENSKNKALKKETYANIAYLDELLGIGGSDPFRYFQQGIDEEMKQEIETLIAERTEAKKAKDFARSDAIRDKLTAMGIQIMDTPEGTLWEKSGQ
ncbi:MAG TPA: cysteine--tRNA ligase [Campylobacteraceae bacterium]|nr:cysteine--tRNA ligase [Campylobacteraceae bacterium]